MHCYFNRNCVTLRARGLYLRQLLEYQKSNLWLLKRFSSPLLLCFFFFKEISFTILEAAIYGYVNVLPHHCVFRPYLLLSSSGIAEKKPNPPKKPPWAGSFSACSCTITITLRRDGDEQEQQRVVSTSCNNKELQFLKLLLLHSANTFKNNWELSLLE